MTNHRGRDRRGEEPASPIVRIQQDLRPVRFGFVVDPAAPDTVLRAIQAATVTWGGRFCPLIPRLKRRRVWDHGASISPVDLMRGLVDAFEPDVLVADDRSEVASLGYDEQRVLSLEALFASDPTQRPGVPMYFVYKELYRREFRFRTRHPRHLLDAAVAADVPLLFHSAMFGSFPTEDALHPPTFRDLGATAEVVEPTDFLRRLTEAYSPLRIGLELLGYRKDSSLTVLVLNPAKVIDVIDYWNLRALGRRVLPLPIKWAEEMAPSLRELLAQAGTRANFVRSRSVDVVRFDAAVAHVGATPAGIVVHDSMPRLFPSWARDADHCERREAIAAQTSSSFPANERIVLAAPELDWIDPRFSPLSQFALSIQTSMYRESEIAQTIPAGIPAVGELFQVTWYPGTFWSASRGFVRLTAAHDSDLSFRLPSAVDAMRKWFASREISASPSSAGRLARQMQRLLPTDFHASAVLRKPVLKALAKAARSATRTVSDEVLSQALSSVHGKHDQAAERHRKRLLDYGVLRPGLLVTCAHCGQRNWYAFDALTSVVECERCVSDFELPVSRPPAKGGWGFRLRGPFAIEGAGQGAYAVLAVFAALSRERLLEDLTWTTGMDLSFSDGPKLEVDFVLCGRERGPRRKGPPVIAVGEAKTGGAFGVLEEGEKQRSKKKGTEKKQSEKKGSEFGPSQLAKARALAVKLPDVGFVFATLADSFTALEKRSLASFVRAQRRARRGPVLVLTAQELLANESFVSVWRSSGAGSERHQIALRLRSLSSFRAVAEATTKLYLDVPTSEEWPAFDGQAGETGRSRGRR